MTLKKTVEKLYRPIYTSPMNFVAAFILFCICFLAMGLGLFLTKKALRKGCSLNPAYHHSSCLCNEKDPNCKKTNIRHLYDI